MITFLRFVLLCLIGSGTYAQSRLPPCLGSDTSRWTNCSVSGFNANGYIYSGGYKDGLPNGQGTATYANGSKYAGEYKDGKRNGPGTFVFANRSTYVGDFKDDIFNGQGTLTILNGDKYVGGYKDGYRNGQGSLYKSDGTIIASGNWPNPTRFIPFGSVADFVSLDINSYPFNQPTQTPALNPPSIVERDRLTAEVEAERRKRQELQVELDRAKELAESRLTEQQRPQAVQRKERRVALVIGNAQYKSSPLENSVNDAADIDQALKRFGFQTTFLRNASLSQMRESTRRFADQLTNADVALIYFAGHGIESKNKNFMIPVNADLKFEYELADQAYDAGAWLEMLEMIKSNNAERVNIVILDACRNNNLIGSRSLNRGLGRMDAPAGTFLSYSTAPGKVAADGGKGERNSPFTKNLLKAIQQPGQPIEEVFKEVRRNVTRETNGAQVPWESTSLTGFFSFRQTR